MTVFGVRRLGRPKVVGGLAAALLLADRVPRELSPKFHFVRATAACRDKGIVRDSIHRFKYNRDLYFQINGDTQPEC